MELIIFTITAVLMLALAAGKASAGGQLLNFTPSGMSGQQATGGDDLADILPTWSIVGVPFKAVAGAFAVPVDLVYFRPSEFGAWFDYMSPSTLAALDEFRRLWGAPVTVSPAAGGLGRRLGYDDLSQHNVDRWGECRAVDFFPSGLNSLNANRAYECAKRAGFTGIGIYTDTSPGWMMHGDTRTDRTTMNPATWARVGRNYTGINEVVSNA